MLFKVSAAPFHFWSPDVYEGAPTLTTALMATVAKIAAFAAFYRLFSVSFSSTFPVFGWVLSAVAAITLLIGNLTALNQDSFKRMLAFSGISHAGYMLLAILSLYGNTSNSLFYYALAYGVSSIGAFTIAIAISKYAGTDKIEGFNGLAKKSPFMAVALTLCMLSMAGIPPFAGFFAKYFIFSEAIRNGHLGLTVLAVVSSIIGVYYYFKVIVAMYTAEPREKPLELNLSYSLVIAVSVLLSLIIGIFPGWFSGLI
jgi:NADH-quinone oxidoreductase subunit N